uniref:Uncharacterized protein n=1 Tax=Glossina austeni TaxID=7395 RepID=A0A1A9VHJ3_GLOAU
MHFYTQRNQDDDDDDDDDALDENNATTATATVTPTTTKTLSKLSNSKTDCETNSTAICGVHMRVVIESAKQLMGIRRIEYNYHLASLYSEAFFYLAITLLNASEALCKLLFND